MSVLIAEDDPASRRLLEKSIRGFGHKVTSAANGDEAWERFNAGDFAFVITDWIMPGLDGLDLCRRIRASARPNYVYIIMVTSRADQEDFLAGMNAGADDFIVKPVGLRELQVRMRAAERILKLHRELREKNRQLEAMNDRLQHISRIDALMQLGNRFAFEEKISEFHDNALRYGRPYGVVLCDVDHFKLYNDQQGHLAGDEALRRIARAIRSSLRSSDGAFRYGGEEIVALLPEQSPPDSLRTAQRLRAAVEALALRRLNPAPGVCLTISCGASACPADGTAPPKWETVIGWADQALYRAKELGRNRAEVAGICAETPAPCAAIPDTVRTRQ